MLSNSESNRSRARLEIFINNQSILEGPIRAMPQLKPCFECLTLLVRTYLNIER